jgi:hypothetical protein
LLTENEPPLSSYQETWKDNSDFLFALLRPELPSTIMLEPGLRALYQDCYQTLLIGRFNASIVMLGVFVEGLVKERIRLKTGEDFAKPLAACIDELKGIKRLKDGSIKQLNHGYLIEPKDTLFLDKFRDKVRNTYAHFDEAKLVNGKIMEAWEIPINDGQPILPELKIAIDEVKAGKRKPLLLHATHPALRSISKFGSERRIAIGLFNLVYDYTLGFTLKYLRQKDYDECQKRFPNPLIDLSPVLMRKQHAPLKPYINDS